MDTAIKRLYPPERRQFEISVPRVKQAEAAQSHLLSADAWNLARALQGEFPHARRRAMPGFADLARDIVEVWGPQPGLGGEVSRLLRDLGRFAAGAWAIYLEATPGGLSVTRMSEALKMTTISGPGRARALLAYLRFIGFVEPARDANDRRRSPYRTTRAMRAAFRERLRQELKVRVAVDPAIPAVLAKFDEDEAAFDAFFVVLSEASMANASLAMPPPVHELDLFSERYAGMIILCEMLQRGEPGDVFPPRGPLDFTVAGLARRCETSRMHVSSLLAKARAAGFLIPMADGRERLSEALLLDMERLIAGTTDMLVGCARIVMGGPPTLYD